VETEEKTQLNLRDSAIYAVILLIAVTWSTAYMRQHFGWSPRSIDAGLILGTKDFALVSIISIAFQMWQRKEEPTALSFGLSMGVGVGIATFCYCIY
jgi:hypothetical protein